MLGHSSIGNDSDLHPREPRAAEADLRPAPPPGSKAGLLVIGQY